jgi:hypothetical protein
MAHEPLQSFDLAGVSFKEFDREGSAKGVGVNVSNRSMARSSLTPVLASKSWTLCRRLFGWQIAFHTLRSQLTLES